MAAITKKPKKMVSKFTTPARASEGSHSVNSTWKVQDRLTNKKYKDRATGLIREAYVKTSNGTITYTDKKGVSTESFTVNLNNLTSSGGTTYTRSSFYPYTGRKLNSVTFKIRAYNNIGEARGKGAVAVKTLNFAKPRKPALGGWSFNKNSSTGIVQNTVTTNAGQDAKERARTRVTVSVEDYYRKRVGTKPWKWNSTDVYTNATSYTAQYDAADYQQISYDDYIKVTTTAYAQGYAGDSDKVSSSYYISYPAQTTIKKIDVSSRGSSGKVTVHIKTNRSTTHPVDEVVLEYLADSSYMTASAIPATESWTASGIKDNGNCTALAIGVQNLIPSAGKRTWVRVKSWHADEEILYRYSEPMYVAALETPEQTAADDAVTIVDAYSADDGAGVVCVLGWNADGTDDSTATELSWDENPNAWKSTKEPSKYTFDWSDGALVDGETTYQDSATITIDDLHDGTLYYIQARRVLESDDGTSYGNYSAQAAVMPFVAPSDVVLDAPAYLPYGEDVELAWTYAGGGTQSAWQLVMTDGTVIANGTGTAGSYTIPNARAMELATDNALSFHVEVSTGSGFVASYVDDSTQDVTVTFMPAPTITLTVADSLTAQPLSFTAECSALCELLVTVVSHGVGEQPAGEVVYSGSITPAWTAGESTYTGTIELPSGRAFIDGGAYTVSVTAVDNSTGLQSDTVTANFTVAWAHQAPAPADMVTLKPHSYNDSSGRHHQSVTLTINCTEDVVSTDVVDVYRVTHDTEELIGRGLPLVYTVTDEYAPFGKDVELSYRVDIRTIDGDVDTAQFYYTLDGRAIRIDFGENSVELPNDIAINDSYSKDVEIRKHSDGASNAYYNDGVTRKASLSTRVIRIREAATEAAVRALANYPGTAFVRLPDGSAYEADVQVSGADTTGALLDVSISAQQVKTTAAYMLPTPVTETESE